MRLRALRRAVPSSDDTDPADAPALELRGVDASYGPLQVLFGVDLQVPRGGKVALLGTNGAGKSTALKVAAGLLPATAGEVRLDGIDVTAQSPAARVARGMRLVAGGRSTCASLTVRENLHVGAYDFLADTERLEAAEARVVGLFPRLGERIHQEAGTLSGGEQQMMAIGRALMSEPDLLLIDELSLGLAPVVVADVVDALERVLAPGTTVVLVEQSLNVARAICDQAVFMEKGEVRFAGAIDELADRGDLVRSVFFGSTS